MVGKKTEITECYSCTHKRNVPGNCHIECVNPDLDMRGEPHGIINGWFFYPWLYDPTWKLSLCKNYEENKCT